MRWVLPKSSIGVRVVFGGRVGVVVVVVVLGEIGPERESEAAKLVEREAAEEAEDLVARQSLRIAGYVLAEVDRQTRDRNHNRAVQHHFFNFLCFCVTMWFLKTFFLFFPFLKNDSVDWYLGRLKLKRNNMMGKIQKLPIPFKYCWVDGVVSSYS
ncbi:hypothetical protein Ddye_026001 [Dipteronia dyeriana]|uniref:Uncharacterized protein n=1 Tax=Dipteronia dyeriana TaxID=168575 RepID=A0AAD9WP34_9ROSI|nr:hypothetical protein Ddye_026001 [Dipteronia dyeriana]